MVYSRVKMGSLKHGGEGWVLCCPEQVQGSFKKEEEGLPWSSRG